MRPRFLAVAVLFSGVLFAPNLTDLAPLSAASSEQQKKWKQALRAADSRAIERLIHSFAVDRDTPQLQKILDSQLAKMPPLSSSKIDARQAEVFRTLLTVGRYFTDAESLEAIGRFLVTRAGSPAGDELLAVVVSGNRSPYVVHALEPLATAERKPGKRLSDTAFRNIRLFAIEKIATVRTWEAAKALVKVLELEEKQSRGELTYVQRRTGALLSKLTGRKASASAVNWAGFIAKYERRRFPSPRKSGKEEETRTAVEDYEENELFAGEEPSPEFVVVVGAKWNKTNTEKLKTAGQLKEGETVEQLLENDRKHRAKYGLSEGLIERMLKEMEIPFKKINREDLDTYDLSKTGVLIFKCAQFHRICICRSCAAGGASTKPRLSRCQCSLDPAVHVSWEPQMSEAAAKRVQAFVKRGGYLFGEDWTVREVIERLWPEHVRTVKKKGESRGGVGKSGKQDLTLKEQTIQVHVATPSHPYAHKILNRKMDTIRAKRSRKKKKEGGRTYVARPPDPPDTPGGADGFEWPVDQDSFAAHVVDDRKVTTLLVSDDVKKACEDGIDASGQGSVALTFAPYGQQSVRKSQTKTSPRRKKRLRGGAVLWTLGHLATQEGSKEDIYSIEYLLLNFINESWERGAPR